MSKADLNALTDLLQTLALIMLVIAGFVHVRKHR